MPSDENNYQWTVKRNKQIVYETNNEIDAFNYFSVNKITGSSWELLRDGNVVESSNKLNRSINS